MSVEIWAIVGIALILAEFAIPGLILVFFGMAALTVSGLMALGEIEAASVQWTVFAITSVVYLMALRSLCKRWLRGRFADASDGSGIVDELEGQRVTVIEDFDAGRGKVLLNGVKWDAESNESLCQGDQAVIVGKTGIRLLVDRF